MTLSPDFSAMTLKLANGQLRSLLLLQVGRQYFCGRRYYSRWVAWSVQHVGSVNALYIHKALWLR